MNLFIIRFLYKFKITMHKYTTAHAQDNVNDCNDFSDRYKVKSISNESTNTKCITIKMVCRLILYLFIYCMGLALTGLYVIAEYLPNNNKLHLNSHDHNTRYLLRYSIALILTLNSIFICPRLIDSIYDLKCCNLNLLHRSWTVCVLRSCSTIIIPLAISVIILDSCGSNWTKLWNECNDKNSFNDYYTIYWTSVIDDQSINVLTHNDVCGTKDLFNIDAIEKCQRQLFDWWTPIIVCKLLMVVLHPFYIWFKAWYRLNPNPFCVNIKCCKIKKSMNIND